MGTVTITNSSVNENHAGVPGPNFPTGTAGGISNYGTMTITDSTITGNEVYYAGGGIVNGGTLTINSSTVSGNGATGQHDGQPWGQVGGISGVVTFTNSTLSNNYASLSIGGLSGGGDHHKQHHQWQFGGGISTNGGELRNTILNNNSGFNIDGTIDVAGVQHKQ